MNRITKAERDRLLAAAKLAVNLDDDGDIVGGFTAIWQEFRDEHGISDQRARSYVSRAARLLRGERMTPGPGRPVSMEPGAPITVWLTPAHVGCAHRLGRGNISAGVRLAIEYWETIETRE